MGAVGASAPMLFKVVGASTHTFFGNFSSYHILSRRKYDYYIFYLNPSTHGFKFLMRPLSGVIKDDLPLLT